MFISHWPNLFVISLTLWVAEITLCDILIENSELGRMWKEVGKEEEGSGCSIIWSTVPVFPKRCWVKLQKGNIHVTGLWAETCTWNLEGSSNKFRVIIVILYCQLDLDSCHIFKKLNILSLKSQYIYSLLLFVVKNRELYKSNSDNNSINTRHSTDLHPPTSKLATFQKGAYCFGIKVFNHLTPILKILSNEMKQCRPALKQFLLINLFYSVNILIGNELKCVCACAHARARATWLVSEEHGTAVCMIAEGSCQSFYTLLILPNWAHIILYKRAGKNVKLLYIAFSPFGGNRVGLQWVT